MKIGETDLPGIGHKFKVTTRNGEEMVIIIHDDGRRELYHINSHDPDKNISIATLDDDEARHLAGIIGGMTYKPKALETMEVALDDLIIEWFKLEPGAKCIGNTIGELKIREMTGATIIAVIDKGQKNLIPGPDFPLVAGSTLIVAGERKQLKSLKTYLHKGL
ncbi:TrkA domain protein [Kroppenstedtia sanguinis]|uniref:Cation:proton antiporter regulatory subunit n=1 Tax=Kroppenstedtia sanguinis TaxID=1380684 RepID=A0ABW4C9V3_9BACL